MRRLFLAALLVPAMVFLTPLSAQVAPAANVPAARPAPGDTITEVRLRDGSVLYGRVVEETPARIVLVTSTGVRLEVPRAQIESMRVTSGRAVDGAFWVEDPNSTRLFFTSTARPLRKGDGYISTFELFFPMVAYGVTDRLTLAGGTPIIPEAIGRLFYVAPKYTVMQRERSAYAIGAIGLWLTEYLDEGSVGILYGAGTWGSRDRALTAGAGWGYHWDPGNSSVSNNPVIMIGGETRVSRRIKLITENWIFNDSSSSNGLMTGGVRFIGDRISADLGLGTALGSDVGCCLPLVNFVYNFGKR